MAVTGFPEYIRVTLGSWWNGLGNGLNNSDVITLQQAGSKWYEAGVTGANRATNRIYLWPRGAFSDTLSMGVVLCKTTADSWNNYGPLLQARGLGNSAYTFKDLWNVADSGTPTVGASNYIWGWTDYAWNPVSLAYGSRFYTGGSGAGPTAFATYATNFFTTFEEYVPPPYPNLDADKTTYRYD